MLELALRNQQPWNASSSGLSSSPSRAEDDFDDGYMGDGDDLGDIM